MPSSLGVTAGDGHDCRGAIHGVGIVVVGRAAPVGHVDVIEDRVSDRRSYRPAWATVNESVVPELLSRRSADDRRCCRRSTRLNGDRRVVQERTGHGDGGGRATDGASVASNRRDLRSVVDAKANGDQ